MILKPSLTAACAALVLLASCSREVDVPQFVDIIPMPQTLVINEGAFPVAGASVYYSPSLDERSVNHVGEFAAALSSATGRRSRLRALPQSSDLIQGDAIPLPKAISFTHDATLAPEAYRINVTENYVTVASSDSHGTFYAIQTLFQMLPPSWVTRLSGRKMHSAGLRCVSIEDAPRFGYRGMHLDVSRHFFDSDEVKRYIDLLAMHKMNRFHWHLSDDQGWRVEIKKYPKLAELGSVRSGTMIEKNWGSNDSIPYGGYFTQEQIREIVAYADAREITIIPEIDLPGHMLGALHAYPELGCSGGPYEVWTRWGVSEEVLCPGKEATFTFIEDVLTEIMELFPSEYIHIGGDECPKDEWEKCPDCQARIKELGLKATRYASAETLLQNYVTARVQEFVNAHGRKIIGWDEILEGELAEGATVMSWRGVDGGIEAAERGFDAIMTPNDYCYFDYYQSRDRENEPLGIGGFVPLEKVYSYDPLAELPLEAQKHILGVQANLWTEYIATPEHLEYMALPRMDALSEVQWCDPSTRDINRLRSSIICNMGPRYDALGYNWRH